MSLLSKDSVRKNPALIAAWSAVIVGSITHLFGLVNILLNHDGVHFFPDGLGYSVTSGRWFLQILNDFLQLLDFTYQLPVVNGLLFIIIVAVAAGFFVDALKLKSKLSCALIGMLFEVFPSATGMLLYRFTAFPYAISILLSVLAAWILRYRFGLLLSAVFTALSMGIYQSNVSFTMCICLFLLMEKTLSDKNISFSRLCRDGLYDCAAIFLGAVLYFICMRLSLVVYHAELSGYQNLESMGRISPRMLPNLLAEAYRSFGMMPFQDYCGLSRTSFIKALYILLWASTVILLLILFIRKVKKVAPCLMTLALLALFPLGANFVVVMNPGFMHTLMLYPFVMVPCIPMVIFDQLYSLPRTNDVSCLLSEDTAKSSPIRLSGKVLGILTALLIFAYGYDANIAYSALYFSNLQTEHYLNALVAQVRMAEGYTTEKKWAFLGEIQDPQCSFSWTYINQIEGVPDPELAKNRCRTDWLLNGLGYDFTYATEEETTQLSQLDAVAEMPCWPNAGSIRVIGDTVVIKCQESAETES